MARGLGTALGVALVTLSLHVGGAGPALFALAAFAVVAGLTGIAVPASRGHA